MRRIYLDTSAYVASMLDEAGAEWVREGTRDGLYVSSVLLVVETRRTLVRLSRERRIDAETYHACTSQLEQDLELFTLRDVTLELCDVAALPPVAVPRALDLVHLRTALWFHQQERLDEFVSLDVQQLRAARELGLSTRPRPKP